MRRFLIVLAVTAGLNGLEAVYNFRPPLAQWPWDGAVMAGEMGRLWHFRCGGGRRFTARFAQAGASRDEAIVHLPRQGRLVLPHVHSADGAKYSNEKVTVWTRGNKAFVTVNQTVVLNNCVGYPQKS